MSQTLPTPMRLLLPLLLLLLLVALQLLLVMTTGGLALLASDSVIEVPETVVNGTLGQKVVLPCEFPSIYAKDPTLKVIWMRGKRTLTLDNNHLDDRLSIAPKDIHTNNKYELQINPVIQSDSEVYKCVIRRQNQPYIQKKVKLVVYVPPTIDQSKSSPTYKTLIENEAYTLTCLAEGVPAPTIRWYKLPDSVFTDLDDAIYVGEGQNHVISNVTRDCDGSFICIAQNGIAPQAKRQFNLNVRFKPQVMVDNKEISQRKGLSSMVMCTISGNPLPEFYWQRNGHKHVVNHGKSCDPPAPVRKYCLYINQRSSAKRTVRIELMVNNLTADDFGEYFCVAKSDLGEDRVAAHIVEEVPTESESKTRPPPRIISEQRSASAVEQAVTGHSPGSLTSRSDGLNAATAATASLSLSAAAALLAASAIEFCNN